MLYLSGDALLFARNCDVDEKDVGFSTWKYDGGFAVYSSRGALETLLSWVMLHKL